LNGNPFASLRTDKLNQIAIDVNLKFGKDSEESNFIIINLIVDEQNDFDDFVKNNPEVMLPTMLDFDNGLMIDPVNGPAITVSTPANSVKVSETSPS
jgi:hypothetical protein